MEDNLDEKDIYTFHDSLLKEGDFMKVLISTIYSDANAVMLSATKFSVDRIFLIVDKEMNTNQKKALDLVNEALGEVVEVKTITCEVYDIVQVAREVVRTIDDLSDKDEIYVNVTGARRTQAFGLLFASYARASRIKSIVYVTEEEKKLVYLPKMDYNLSKGQKKILEEINKKKEGIKLSEFAEKIDLSRGMLYRSIKELQDLGLIYEEDGFKLTDAGRIAVL